MSQEFIPIPEINLANPTNADTSVTRGGSRRESIVDQFAKAAAKSHAVRAAVNFVVLSRADFKTLLQGYGLGLETSASELNTTGSFIESSYVIFTSHNSLRVPMLDFLEKYPEFKTAAQAVENHVKPTKNNINL
jgi:hypothetical protein